VILMTDDTGWKDFGAYSGGGITLGHPTPNIDRFAKEGAMLTSWYGQASCTAGRAHFSGKWHLVDQPKFYPIEHGFDEMKECAAYYPGVISGSSQVACSRSELVIDLSEVAPRNLRVRRMV
jgi:arylsulfatase